MSALLALSTIVLVVTLTIPDDIFTPATQKIGAIAMTQANPLNRAIKLTVLAFGIVIMLAQLTETRRMLRHLNLFFLIFLFLVPASYLWSVSRPDTLARFISIMSIVSISTAFCLIGWHARRFQSITRATVTLLLLGSVLLYLTNPDLAIEQGGLKGAWHGLASQKNIFGMIAGMGVLLWLHAVLTREARLLTGLAGLALSCSCLVFSRSSTSILATILSCTLLLLCGQAPRPLRRYMPYLVGAFVTLVLVYALTILHIVPGLNVLLVPITHLTGKDTTFSNRSEIWAIIQNHIRLRPLLGSGYGAYWIGPVKTSASYIFISQMWFYPTESHNGYLEITNDLGFCGLAVLIGYLIQFTRDALKVLRVDRAQGALFLGLFFQQAIINLSESCWFEINSGPVLPIMTLATLALARTLQLQARAARRAHACATPAGMSYRGLRPAMPAAAPSRP